MLSVEVEALVLTRALERGDLTESDLKREHQACTDGREDSEKNETEQYLYSRRIDALIAAGKLSEQQVALLLQDVGSKAAEPSPKEAADSMFGFSVKAMETARTMLPGDDASARGSGATSQATAQPHQDSTPTPPTRDLAQTVDDPLVEYIKPRPISGFPVDSWDRYEFIHILGQGGMGAVYKARDKRLGRIVALKFIRGGDDHLTQRFLQEARAQSRLEHDSICRVLEVGAVEGKAYIAMQLVNGQPLDRVMRELSLTEKVQIMRDVALAMHYAHEKGIIHRDLKPANIMVERRKNGPPLPVVMDFGLAREAGDSRGLTESGAVMGTPAYMSPEQARGEARRLDSRSDVYSLGATLFDLLTGEAPFEADSAVNIILKVITQEAPTLRSKNPQLPEALDTICARCLAKEKDQRYSSAQALADDLSRFLNDQRILARRISLWQRLRWRAKQNKPAAALVLSLLVSVIGFAGYGLRARYVAQKQAELARQIGQDSKDIEWMIRTAHALPLHNVEREQELVRKRMELIEGRLRSYGDLASGLAQYALGRGRLSLHEHKKARVHLEQARKQGLHSPELSAALGRVLGELYNEALLEARRSGEKSWVELRQKELQREYLDPAITELTQALAHRDELLLDSPEFIAGLLDYYRGNYDQADGKAQAALVATPWLSEAAKLRGEVAHAQALEQIGLGKHDAARTLLERAIGQFQAAADISRSDGQIHAALARAYMDLSEVDRFQGKPQDKEFELAQAAAERTVTALPSDSSGYLERARVLYFVGKSLLVRRKESIATFNQSIASAEQAIKRSAQDFIAWDTLGNSLVYRGFAEGGQSNGNPEPTWQRAVECFEKALAIAPNFPWAHNDLGGGHVVHASYLAEHGKDPRSFLQQAIERFKRAIAIDPRYQFAYANMVSAFCGFADYSQEHGLDFTALVDEAERLAKACGAGCESYLIFQQNMAVLHITLAQHTLAKGDDPRVALGRARSYLMTLHKLNKHRLQECLYSRYPDMFEAEHKLAIGENPMSLVEAALADVSSCKALDPQAEDPYVIEARLYRTCASWAEHNGGQPLRCTRQALQAAQKAVELNPESIDAVQESARACIKLASLVDRKENTERLSEALTTIDKGLKVKGDSGPLLALRAVALKKTNVAGESEESWKKALAINPLLAREYGAELRAP